MSGGARSGAAVRPAAVAGFFYPGDPEVLARTVDELLGVAAAAAAPAPKAVLVPHAGYVYSGAIAASAYRLLEAGRDAIRRVVLVGPAHRVRLRGIALPAAQAFATPLGTVAVDRGACAELADLPQVRVSAEAHALEHALEVQLPFLQRILGHFTIVPLVVGDTRPGEVEAVLERLWGGRETLIVVSSDLSHYRTYDSARELDRATVASIVALRPLHHHEQACGAGAINGFLPCAREHRLAATLLDLRSSGDTAGDRDRVVGYCAIAFDVSGQRAHGEESHLAS